MSSMSEYAIEQHMQNAYDKLEAKYFEAIEEVNELQQQLINARTTIDLLKYRMEEM